MIEGNLPPGWDLVPLGELGRYINGRAFKPADWETSGLPIIRIQNLTNVDAPFNRFPELVEDKYYVHSGDLLISWSATLGAFIWDRGDAILNQHIFRVEVNDSRVDKLYLKYAVQSALDELSERTHGATMRHVTKGEFESFQVPVPRSLAEQRRIVARLEALLGEVREMRKLQAEIEADVGRLMEAVLAEVFGDSHKWPVVPLGEVFEFRSELIRPNDGAKGELTFVGLQHIESGSGIRLGEDRINASQLDGRKFRFSPGQILYGSLRPYLNKVWIADCVGICSVDQFVLCPDPKRVDTGYLAHYLRSKSFLRSAQEQASALDLPRIRRDRLVLIEMPLPPLAKQRDIAQNLDVVTSGLVELKVHQKSYAAAFEPLEQSMLTLAFRGALC